MAKLYDGSDRTYLAALNIACGTDPERRDKILADFEKHFPEWNDKVADLVWELRPKSMLPKMEKLLTDTKLTVTQRARIVDILAVNDDPNAGKTVLAILSQDHPVEVKAKAIENLKLFLPTKWSGLAKDATLKSAIAALLADAKTVPTGLQLIAVTNYTASLKEVEKLAGDDKQPLDLRIQAVRTLGQLKSGEAVDALINLGQPQNPITVECIKALGLQIPNGPKAPAYAQKAFEALKQAIELESASVETKQAALVALAGTRTGTGWLLKLKEDGKMPASIVADAGRLLRNSPFQGERNKALILFPAAAKLDLKKLAPIADLAKKVGSAERGKEVFKASLKNDVQCAKCHTIRNQGGNIGPDLSMIGVKGSKENIYESLITPSKAIADQYLSWKIDSEDGQSVVGLLVSESADKIVVRDANGKDYTFPAKGTEKKKQTISIMPEDVLKAMTEEELIDLVEYLYSLKTPLFVPDAWQIMGPLPREAFDKIIGAEDWKTIRIGQNGYFDLAAFHGDKAKDSCSILMIKVDSPEDQDATILLGTDDGCRLFVNNEKVFGHDRSEAATPEKDSVKVKLKKGTNTIALRITNGNNPHGFYLSIAGAKDLKIGK